MGQTISNRRERRRVCAKPCEIVEREFVNDCIFTDESGRLLSPWQAIHRTNFDSVFYRGVRMTSLFGTMKSISEEGHDDQDIEGIEVLCGYSPYKDAFYYLHYIKDDRCVKHDDCMVCLEQLRNGNSAGSRDVVVRLTGGRCVHDLHYHCYKNLVRERLTVAGCCRGCRLSVEFHMKIVGYTEHRFIVAGTKLREYRCSIVKLDRPLYMARQVMQLIYKNSAPDMVDVVGENRCVGVR